MMENEKKGDRNEGLPRKRLLRNPNPKESFVTVSPESTVSSDSSSDRFTKKTRELPNLSDCHSCGVRINYTNPRERLQPLDSMWRVVLLCKKCTKRVKSSELCPYCFTAVIDEKNCFKCRDCQHSIHKNCVAKHGSGIGFSVCVDCWVPDAVANSIRARRRKRRKRNRESCERDATLPESRGSVLETNGPHFLGEEVGKKAAAAAKTSEDALKKVVVEKNAVELAKGVLSVAASRKAAGTPQKKAVDDSGLAYILHRAINSSPRTSRYACLMGSFSGENAPIACYSRRRARKKTSLMNSSSLNVPLICYSRRHRKGSMRNSAFSDAPLVCYSRRRSRNRACSHVRECECLTFKLSERIDKRGSESSAGLKAFIFGFSAEGSLNGKECHESDGEGLDREPHRSLLKYHRVGKGTPRPSVFVKDPDCGSCMDSANLNTEAVSYSVRYGNGNNCHEICEKCDTRFLLKYKRSVKSKPKFRCKVEEFSSPLPSNYPLRSTCLSDTRFQL